MCFIFRFLVLNVSFGESVAKSHPSRLLLARSTALPALLVDLNSYLPLHVRANSFYVQLVGTSRAEMFCFEYLGETRMVFISAGYAQALSVFTQITNRVIELVSTDAM